MCHPKKVGTLPVAGCDETKQTNEIGMFVPLLDGIDIKGKDITADALVELLAIPLGYQKTIAKWLVMLTQRKLASYVVGRGAHHHFTAKGNQATLKADIALHFEIRQKPDFVEVTPPDHGRIETRRIWCSAALNEHIGFPHVGQVFMIEREAVYKKSGKVTHEIALGVTSRTPEQANPQRILKVNRDHWTIENRCHHVIDWNFDGDRTHPYRPRPRECHSPAALRGWGHPVCFRW